MTVEKRKWRGTVSSRWAVRSTCPSPGRLIWLTTEGTLLERPGRAPRATSDTWRSASTGGWWVATRVGEGATRRWKIDAATPPSIEGDVLSFVDLDLDVVIGPGCRLAVRDAGQFVARGWRDSYPPRVAVLAVLGVLAALGRVATRRWPFDGTVDRLT